MGSSRGWTSLCDGAQVLGMALTRHISICSLWYHASLHSCLLGFILHFSWHLPPPIPLHCGRQHFNCLDFVFWNSCSKGPRQFPLQATSAFCHSLLHSLCLLTTGRGLEPCGDMAFWPAAEPNSILGLASIFLFLPLLLALLVPFWGCGAVTRIRWPGVLGSVESWLCLWTVFLGCPWATQLVLHVFYIKEVFGFSLCVFSKLHSVLLLLCTRIMLWIMQLNVLLLIYLFVTAKLPNFIFFCKPFSCIMYVHAHAHTHR